MSSRNRGQNFEKGQESDPSKKAEEFNRKCKCTSELSRHPSSWPYCQKGDCGVSVDRLRGTHFPYQIGKCLYDSEKASLTIFTVHSLFLSYGLWHISISCLLFIYTRLQVKPRPLSGLEAKRAKKCSRAVGHIHTRPPSLARCDHPLTAHSTRKGVEHCQWAVIGAEEEINRSFI